MNNLKTADSEVYAAIQSEVHRQNSKLELIASENFVSLAVLEAMGSALTNKYAEGYPAKRYYGGCEFVDFAENLARDRAKKLFGAEYVNVQPHSGSQANMAVYFSFIKPGDTVLGMNLSHGGHLTHGSPVNFSGQLYRFIAYGISKDTGRIDYNDVEEKAKREKPKMITVGASAYSRNIDYKAFREIADKVGAFLFADIAHPAGLIAAKLHNDPLPYCHVVSSTTHDSMVIPGVQGGALMHVIAAKAVAFGENLQPEYRIYAEQIIKNAHALAAALVKRGYNIISGGTDNHLMLLDLQNKNLTGKDTQETLDLAGITVNKNAVPFDDKSPLITSGIRVGTPAVTTRGLKEPEMEIIAGFIDRALTNRTDEKVVKQVSEDVKILCAKFPLYPELI